MEEDGTSLNTSWFVALFVLIILFLWIAEPSKVEKDIQVGNGLYCEYLGDELLCDGEFYASTGYVTEERAELDKRIKEIDL